MVNKTVEKRNFYSNTFFVDFMNVAFIQMLHIRFYLYFQAGENMFFKSVNIYVHIRVLISIHLFSYTNYTTTKFFLKCTFVYMLTDLQKNNFIHSLLRLFK